MQHSHNIIDKDNHFIINPVTRKIQPETHEKNKMVEGDHNSEKYTFEVPKLIEGHDMSQCNIVQIHYLNVSSDKSKKVEDVYEVDDLGVLENKDDTLAFTWTIKETATRYNGLLSFAITFKCTTNDTVDYAWHTEIYTGITIGKGMNNSETIVIEYSDILEKWKKELFAIDGTIQTTARKSLEEIEKAKNNSLESIAQHGTVQVSNEEPTDPNVDLFINPDETVSVSIPEINDSGISTEDTWSSEKIDSELKVIDNKTLEVKEETAQLKEEIVELTPIIGDEYEAYDISYEFNKMGFINSNGNITHSSTSRYTEHIPIRANDMFYYKLVEDNKNSYGIAIYDNDKKFIKGYKISTPETTYMFIKGSFVVTEGSFIKFSSLNATDENLAPLLYVKKNKSNEHSFKKYKEVYGDVEYKFLDISNDLHEIRDKYLNVSGDAIDYPNQDSFVTDYYDVEEGEIYKYVTRALYKNPSYVVYDKHRRLIDKGGTISGINTGDIVIPPMGAYIRFNKMSDTSNVFKVSKKIPKPLAEVIDDKITVKSMDIPAKHTELQVNIMNGFLNESNKISGDTEDSEYVHTDYINISEYKWFNTHVYYGWAAVGYLLLDENKIVLYALKSSTGKDEKIILQTKDILSKYPKAKYIRFVGEKIGKKSLKVFVNHKTTDYDLALETVISKSNMLYNKKIAFCGDSFTEASNLGDNYYDAYYGCYKSYGWRIADRNGMRLYHDGISGSTMHVVDIATPTKSNPFAYERYKKIPKDCDYIILQFGLNEFSIVDSPDTKGTKESVDTSTMWGSWNVVLEYLITNHPKARIGVIMSDAWMPQSYYETLKEICEWWGIPLLDLGGDANIPVMNSGRRVGCGLTLNPKVTELRNREFYQNFESGDAHPNDAGHEWRSTVIEDFIRRL